MPETPQTPTEWLAFLQPKLVEQATEVDIYRRYYNGDHRLAYATQKFLDAFARWFPPMADNWMQIVVDSSVERLGIIGFRFGGVDVPADSGAWDVWQQNDLDKVSRIVHTEAIKCGVAYLLVDPTADDGPRITGEHPQQVYVHEDASTGERTAALKRWTGDDKHAYANVYLPDAVHKFKSTTEVRSNISKPTFESLEVVPHDLDVVPMIPVENNPDMLDGGTSDLRVVMPIQDRVNKLCLDLDVSSEFNAAPQRWATGWEPAKDQDGNILPNTEQKALTSRFLAFESEETRVGQLASGDPAAYVGPIEMYIQHMAALSRTPPHYLLGKMANLSGDALKAAETGLVAKVKSKQDDFADSWEEAMGLATGKDTDTAEVIWRDPESRTFGQLVDGVVKLRTSLSLPLEIGWEMIGLSPQQIERAKKLIGLPDRGDLPPPSNQVPPGAAPQPPGTALPPGANNQPPDNQTPQNLPPTRGGR